MGGGDHYRGVMLSTRPPQERGRKFNVGQVPVPFVPGGILHKAVGLPPAHEEAERNVVAKRAVRESRRAKNVYSRHRDFLKELQKLKEEEKQMEEKHTKEGQEKWNSLRDSQARIRRGLMEGDPEVLKALQAKVSPTATSQAAAGLTGSASSTQVPPDQVTKSKKKKKKKGGSSKKRGPATAQKPAWALTEEEAQRQADGLPLSDAPAPPQQATSSTPPKDEEGFGAQGSDLELDFDVDELLGEEFEDFDELESFYEALSDGEELPDDVVEVIPAEVDPETGETIKKRMVRRVRPSKGGGGVPKKQTAASIGQQQGISEELARELQERLEKRRLAKQLMQDPEVRSIHSRASVQNLVDRAVRRNRAGIKEAPVQEVSLLHRYKQRGQCLEKEKERAQSLRKPVEPLIVTEGGDSENPIVRRRHDCHQTQNLPYMYRCHAV